MSSERNGNTIAPCENFDPETSFVQKAAAGARLKVGWLSGNRGGFIISNIKVVMSVSL
jgi:hypothetical protein